MQTRELCNAEITLRPDRLNFPLVQWHATQLASYRFRFRNVPADITGLEVRVGIPGSTDHYVCGCVAHKSGEWSGLAVPGCFPTAGETMYEVWAVDANDQATFLGEGAISITARVSGNEVVATVMDSSGGTHTLTAVQLDNEWTLQID